MWSLGISLYELAVGKFPFKASTDFEMLTSILNCEPVLLPTDMKFSMDFRRFVSVWYV